MMPRRIMVAALVFLAPLESHISAQTVLPIVPKPQQVILGRGMFRLAGSQINIRLSAGNAADHRTARSSLDSALDELGLWTADWTGSGNPHIWIGIPAEDAAFADHARKTGIWPDDHLGEEGYALSVGRKQITIAATTPAGLFYGVQSLVQLLRGAESQGQLPVVTIKDWPDFKYRALMDDISRGPIPTMDFFKQQIRRSAELKMNLLSHYVENVVVTKGHPDLTPPGTGLTLDQWAELRDYAADYHMDLLGNFQSFGHFASILKHPAYSSLGEGGRMISPVNEDSYVFLESIYDEFVPIFDTPWFNINADETWDLGVGESKALVDSIGIAAVFAGHINRLDAMMKSHGKRTMLWGDFILAHSESIDMLPKDAILATWEYDNLSSYEHLLRPLAESGRELFISPGVLNSNRIMPDYIQTRGNISGFIKEAAQFGVQGIILTVWDDGGQALFTKDWYGVAYSAELSWNVAAGNQADFDSRLDRAMYGDLEGTLAKAINLLSRLTDLGPTQRMNEQVFMSHLVPSRGATVGLINLDEWDQVLEITTAIDDLIAGATPRSRAGDLDYVQFTADQYRYMAEARHDILQAADHYRVASDEGATDGDARRQNIVKALGLIVSVGNRLADLRGRNTQLWLRENRVHALDLVQASYDGHLADLEETTLLLQSALAEFDKGSPLLRPAAVRLQVEQTRSRYFQGWLMAGPFENDDNSAANPDHLAQMGGIADARPTVYSVIDLPDGTKRPWQKIYSLDYGHLDLARQYGPTQQAVAYAYARITSPKAQTIRATLGSNSGITAYLNGLPVHRNQAMRSLTLDEDEFELPLVSGNNHLMLKIDQGTDGWGFSFQLPGLAFKNNKFRYYLQD